ncbi:nucleoside deaminase [Hyphomicrobium sp. D-2]|uniref:nucleoside deaminase n=1 Tax=Hyphomicrobium sp. D-2 TaxID=3041621 RepID=UPI0024580697|nr:nucleoside deaminase [Hyphomicrobium sp. D-2]MDH4982208.1 nucleoside deaminase [Hyphomicrobium sp. D-2]
MDTLVDTHRFLRQAVALARANVDEGGRPFGAVVVRNGEVIATGVNEFHRSGDITDHAELLALRAVARAHGSDALKGAAVFASGHPCPMCLAAMRMAGVGLVAYAYSNADAEPFGLSTAAIYDDLRLPLGEQSMAIRHVPPVADDAAAAGDGLYAHWAHRG